jgi:hypothetical protein
VQPLFKFLLLASVFALPFSGCTNNDPEDKAFFYRGWMHPETDADEERRMQDARDAGPPPVHDPLID